MYLTNNTKNEEASDFICLPDNGNKQFCSKKGDPKVNVFGKGCKIASDGERNTEIKYIFLQDKNRIDHESKEDQYC